MSDSTRLAAHTTVPGQPRRRDISLDSLRGIAVFLMVAGHVIGPTADRGMQVADGSLWRLSHTLLEDLRMPLFTVLSGLVFALRPVPELGAWARMVRGKARRLLVPLLVVAPAYMAFQAIAPASNDRPELSDLLSFTVLPYQHFWFLQSIFVIFAIVGALDGARLLNTPRQWALWFGLACIANLTVNLPTDLDLLSTNGTARIIPFFLLGLGLHRFRDEIAKPSLAAVGTAVFALAYGATVLFELRSQELVLLADRSLSLIVAVSGLTTLVLIRFWITSRCLAWIGHFSFGIYLLHIFGTAPTRMVLEYISLDSAPVIFAASMVLGIAGPILAQATVGSSRWVSWAVFGQAPAAIPPIRKRNSRDQSWSHRPMKETNVQ